MVGGHGRLHQAHSLGVRGDGRWVGVARAAEGFDDANSGEAVLGLCASGTLCVVADPHLAHAATA